MTNQNSNINTDKMLRSIKSRQIIFPILIGFSVIIYLFWGEFNQKAFSEVPFTKLTILFIFLAAFMMLTRDFGYVVRLKLLSGKKMSWRQCIRVIFLWEFTSAVTPSAVGGTSVAVFFIYKENVSFGESSAIVLATAFLDELYFLIMFPIIILSVNHSELFTITNSNLHASNWSTEFLYFTIIGYSLKAIFTLLVGYGLFINPLKVKYLLFTIFKLRFIRKWRRSAVKTGNDIVLASYEFKNKSFIFWLKAFFTTFIAWTSRYWVVNLLFLAFFVVPNHFMIFARQLVMWIMMLVSPTPGGSGFAEFIFSKFLGQYIPVITLIPILVILWRLITYYPYLIIGAFLVPIWIKNKFTSNE